MTQLYYIFTNYSVSDKNNINWDSYSHVSSFFLIVCTVEVYKARDSNVKDGIHDFDGATKCSMTAVYNRYAS